MFQTHEKEWQKLASGKPKGIQMYLSLPVSSGDYIESSGGFVVRFFWLSWFACFVETGFYVSQPGLELGTHWRMTLSF